MSTAPMRSRKCWKIFPILVSLKGYNPIPHLNGLLWHALLLSLSLSDSLRSYLLGIKMTWTHAMLKWWDRAEQEVFYSHAPYPQRMGHERSSFVFNEFDYDSKVLSFKAMHRSVIAWMFSHPHLMSRIIFMTHTAPFLHYPIFIYSAPSSLRG